MTDQAKELADKPHVVIATPGRLADHIESGTNFSLSKVQMLVRKMFFSIQNEGYSSKIINFTKN